MGRIPFFDLQGQKWSSFLCMFCSVFGAFDFVALVEGWVPRLSYIARVINLQHFIERHLFRSFALGRCGIFEYNKLLQLFSIPISFWNKDVSVRHINWDQKISWTLSIVTKHVAVNMQLAYKLDGMRGANVSVV